MSSAITNGPRLIGLVPAVGGGLRFGADIPDAPRPHADLAGQSVLARTLRRLLEVLPLDALYIAIAPGDATDMTTMSAAIRMLPCSGATRTALVRNALEAIAHRCEESDWILVHDAARPCVPPDALRRLITSVADDPVGGFLAVPVADTLKRATDHDASRALPHVRCTESRAGLWQAQSPQVFRYGVLRAALALDGSVAMTDEAQAVEVLAATGACGRPVLVRGSTHNIKIINADDLALAAAILHLQEVDSGNAAGRAVGGEVFG